MFAGIMLLLKRFLFTDETTIGALTYQGVGICWTLEDKDRGLNQLMPAETIKQIKVFGKTAIPIGKYKFEFYNSPKHGEVYLLKNVPGFEYIEIHPANTDEQLLGCIAPGSKYYEDKKGSYAVSESRIARDKLYKLIQDNKIDTILIYKDGQQTNNAAQAS